MSMVFGINVDDSIPGASEAVNYAYGNSYRRILNENTAKEAALKKYEEIKSDPVSFVKKQIKNEIVMAMIASIPVAGQSGREDAVKDQLKKVNDQSAYLLKNGLSIEELKTVIKSGEEFGKQQQAYWGPVLNQFNIDTSGGSLINQIVSVAVPVALAYFMPGVGASIGAELFATQIAAGTMTAATATAIGTAVASTAVQTAQGVDFETALTNATVNAVVSTQSPTIANDIAKTVGSPGVADAITSGGASIVSTLAKGGSMDDAFQNAGAAIVASGVSGQTDRTVGAAVGGAITGGATGAALGAVGELGRPTGGSSSSTTTPSDSVDTTGASGVSGDVVVTAPRETTIGDTNIQIPTPSPTPEVVVTAPRAPTGIGDTNIQVADTVSTTPPATREEAPVEITAPRIPTNIAETDIQNVDVVGEKEKNEELISEEATKEPSLYKPSLFVYSGKYPSAGGGALSRALGTDLQTAGGASTPTTGLTSYRAAGEIEGEETGGKRRNVWNEESLRLKDALGL